MKRITRIISALLVPVMILAASVITVSAKDLYNDVKSARWSAANIAYVTEKGYMAGVGGGNFAPAKSVTRGMVVTVLYRLNGSHKVRTKSTFKDVPRDSWFTEAVDWASFHGVVNGTSETTFSPNADISREALATMIYRYAVTTGVKEYEPGNSDAAKRFNDWGKVSSWAKTAMEWAISVGLINGMTETTVEPKKTSTREQFAAILNRYATYEDFDYEVAYNAPAIPGTYTEKEYPLVTDADVYVSTSGSDSNPGTLEKPVKTFEKARDLVREIKKTKTSGGIKVAFMAGEYGKLDITLTSEDKGTAECPITYCKYGDGDVVFNNGATFALDEFKPLTDTEKSMFLAKSADRIRKISLDGYFEAGLPKGITLYEGTTACVVARNPDKKGTVDNYYYGNIEAVDGDVHYPGMVLSGPLKREADKCDTFEDMIVKGYIIRGYRVDYFYVTGYDRTTGILEFDPEREVHAEYP